MKLVKKIMAAACAVAMVATAASSLMVAHAEMIVPTLRGVLEYDAETKEGQYTFYMEDLKPDTESNTANMTMASFDMRLVFDDEGYDPSMYASSGPPASQAIKKNVLVNEALTGNVFAYNENLDTIGISYGVLPEEGIHEYTYPDWYNSFEIATIKFKVIGEKTTISIDFAESGVYEFNDEWSEVINQYYYGTSNNSKAEWILDVDEIPGVIEWEIPDNDNASAAEDQIASVPSTDGTGIFAPSEGDGSDRAIAKAVTLNPGAGTYNAVKWSLTRTKDTVSENGTVTKMIPNIDAAAKMTIGLVFSWDGIEYDNVTVTGAELVNE